MPLIPGPLVADDCEVTVAGAEIDQVEKRRVLANDQSVREQQQKATTYFAFGAAEADEPRGRFQNSGGRPR